MNWTDPDSGVTYSVVSVWRQEAGPGIHACTSYEVIGGPKPYARRWDGLSRTEWGWQVHDSARSIWAEERRVLGA